LNYIIKGKKKEEALRVKAKTQEIRKKKKIIQYGGGALGGRGSPNRARRKRFWKTDKISICCRKKITVVRLAASVAQERYRVSRKREKKKRRY